MSKIPHVRICTLYFQNQYSLQRCSILFNANAFAVSNYTCTRFILSIKKFPLQNKILQLTYNFKINSIFLFMEFNEVYRIQSSLSNRMQFIESNRMQFIESNRVYRIKSNLSNRINSLESSRQRRELC